MPAIVPATLTPGQTLTFFAPSELSFSIGGAAAIKRADIKSGKLSVKFSNDLAEPLDLLYKIPSATKYGMPLVIFETVPPGINSLIKTYDLSGYSLNMTGLSGNLYNTIVQTYTVVVNPNANPVEVTYGKGAKAELSYSGLIPQYIEGYFGQQNITVPVDTTTLDFLKNVDASGFSLSTAAFNFKIINEFGAEFTANLNNVKSINTKNNSTVNLSTSQLSNINMNRAAKSGSTIFPAVKTISLTPSNSNITAFLSNLPNKLTYSGNVNVNPLGNLAAYTDFAFYGTGIKVIADINIPLQFNANYFKLVSNAKLDVGNLKQLDNVNGGKFIISTSNGYPFKAKLQAYLLDEQNQVIDSLFDINNNIISNGILDASNVVTVPTLSKLEVPVDKQKIENLKRSKQVRIETYLLMPPNPPDIKIYDNYTISVNIIAELNYRVERK